MINTNKFGKASVHAKLILIGEHSVVYGQPAIALPVTILQMTTSISPNRFGQFIDDNNESRSRLSLMGDDFEGIRQLILRLLARFESENMPFSLEINSNIPRGRGLGASAALATAITRSFFDYFEIEISRAELFSYVNFAENITHGKSSGIDATTVNSNLPIWYIKDKETSPFEVHLPGFLVIGDTGIHGLTSQAISTVQQKLQEHPERAQEGIEQLGYLATQAKAFLTTGDLSNLGQAMTDSQTILSTLGVSHPKLDSLIETAFQYGALGAKLTGSGLGGVMVALAAGEKQAIKISQELLKSGAKNTWIYTF